MALSIQLLRPASSVKRRANERLRIEARVSGADSPEGLLVELWAPIHDPAGKRPAAYALAPAGSDSEGLLFANDITLPYPGFFPLSVRVRSSSDRHWTWAGKGPAPVSELWVDPEWVYDAIVYNAFVRYFGAREIKEDGEVRNIEPGTFSDVKAELEKLKAMGVDVLYLNPVYPIGELMKNYNPHDLLPDYLQPGCPYSIKDYKSVDAELSFGGEDALSDEHPFSSFRRLVDEAHRLGIRVFMDLVFNHSAHDAVFQRLHPEWFLYKMDVTSLEEPYIHPEELVDGKPWGDAKHTFAPYDHGRTWRENDGNRGTQEK